ncbi:MAG: peptidase U32 family protein, partial [Thermodesulfobacteriota bacterium]
MESEDITRKIVKRVELICPAGNLPSLKAAIDNGADVVYTGFSDATNARNFEGLNFTPDELSEGIAYAHRGGKQVYLAVNTFPQMDTYRQWYASVDRAVEIGADAIILANLGILKYAREHYPDINIHLSVQASASNYESINFYREAFHIKRVVLPRVLTVEEMRLIKEKTDVEIEVFALGGLCINIEGRCYLSSFVTGASTNTEGACSPARFVRFTNEDDH